MNFLEMSKKRFSCRKFKDAAVEENKINDIIEAALSAPTAVNKQPFKIIVIDDKDILKELSSATKYMFNAPLCFAVCVSEEKAYKRGYDGKCSAEIDGSIVTTHMMLEALDLGLGTTWVMAFNPNKAEEILNVSDGYKILSLLPTGYPAEDCEVSPLHYSSITKEDAVKKNSF